MQDALSRCAPMLLFSLTACMTPDQESPADPAAPSPGELASEVSIASAATMVAALDIPAVVTVSNLSLVSPHADAARDLASLGALTPSKGGSFVVLSTGKSGDQGLTAEPGFDFPPAGEAGDIVTLRFDIFVPHYLNQMSFDYTFLTSEFPEYVASAFTDTFKVTVTDWIGDRVVVSESANSPQMKPASAARVGSGPFFLQVADASLVDTTFGTGAQLDAGIIEMRRVTVPIRHGWMTVQLDIRDIGDGILDSAALIDNLSFSAVELIDPQGSALIDPSGAITQTRALLATEGTPIRAVAADGVTPLLLRSKAPGPGTVTLSLASGLARDGGLSAHDGSNTWSTSVTVDTVFVNGGHYAFVLYRSPADFNRGGDDQARERVVPLTWAHASDSGTGDFAHALELAIARPPLVVVPDLWSSCSAWSEGLLHPTPAAADPRRAFAAASSCVAHEGRLGFNTQANQLAIPNGIATALSAYRNKGVAVTQVDLVAHGSGGILTRRHLDTATYRRMENFQQGDVNRLITLNTAHLGARMADEVVAFRGNAETLGQWSNINTTLKASQIFLDPSEGHVAVDELRTTSPIIRALGQAQVPFHALVGTGGRTLPRAGLGGMIGSMLPLYEQMEQFHPATHGLPVATQQSLILGAASRIFCSDAIAQPEENHDLFSTTWEQRAGLADPFVTKIPVIDPLGVYFRTPAHPDYTARLVQLLNSPLAGGLFSPTIPATAAVPLLNSCPDPR
jgi:hypothetical protein